MAEKDAPERAPQESEGPSLELPSFGFRRKRKPRPTPAESAPEDVERGPVEPVEAAPKPEPEPERVVAARDEAPPAPEPEPPAEPAATRAPLFVEEEAPPNEAFHPPRRRPSMPQIGAVPAALATGLVVGMLTVGLVWASQAGCEVVRGTSSCGDAGFLLLLAVLVVAGWVGGALLRGFGVAEGGSTSFLAMGLVAVLLMLFLADQLFAWWMVAVVPGVAMLTYVVAHRVSTAMVQPGGPEMHR